MTGTNLQLDSCFYLFFGNFWHFGQIFVEKWGLVGLLGRFLSKIPPIRQCDSDTKSKISSFFEQITVYTYATWRQRQGGVGVGWWYYGRLGLAPDFFSGAGPTPADPARLPADPARLAPASRPVQPTTHHWSGCQSSRLHP